MTENIGIEKNRKNLIVMLLYLILRDVIPAGVLESIVGSIEQLTQDATLGIREPLSMRYATDSAQKAIFGHLQKSALESTSRPVRITCYLLYMLLRRSSNAISDVEAVVAQMVETTNDESVHTLIFSNPHLQGYAQDLCDRLWECHVMEKYEP